MTDSKTEYGHTAKCRFTTDAWRESAWVDVDGTGTTMGDAYFPQRGLTLAEVDHVFSGDLEGRATGKMLVAYPGGTATFEGYTQFTGSIGGHDGSCVWRVVGTYDGAAHERLEIVPGLGTGGLEGLRGEAMLDLQGDPADGYEMVLAYDL